MTLTVFKDYWESRLVLIITRLNLCLGELRLWSPEEMNNVLITTLWSGMNYTLSSTGIEVDPACEPWRSVLASRAGSLQRHQSVHWLLICNDKAQRIFAVQAGLLVMLNDLPSYRGRYSLPAPVGKHTVNPAKTIWLWHLEPTEMLQLISRSTLPLMLLSEYRLRVDRDQHTSQLVTRPYFTPPWRISHVNLLSVPPPVTNTSTAPGKY